jgi:hypothetical protein
MNDKHLQDTDKKPGLIYQMMVLPPLGGAT